MKYCSKYVLQVMQFFRDKGLLTVAQRPTPSDKLINHSKAFRPMSVLHPDGTYFNFRNSQLDLFLRVRPYEWKATSQQHKQKQQTMQQQFLANRQGTNKQRQVGKCWRAAGRVFQIYKAAPRRSSSPMFFKGLYDIHVYRQFWFCNKYAKSTQAQQSLKKLSRPPQNLLKYILIKSHLKIEK